jgi:hypothetical protein
MKGGEKPYGAIILKVVIKHAFSKPQKEASSSKKKKKEKNNYNR